MNNIVIISDIHGCYKTLMKLIDDAKQKWGQDIHLVFCGDLIDRGPSSRQVVEYAMQNNIPTVMGNHEDLCLAYSGHEKRGFKSRCKQWYDFNIWLDNGGDAALEDWSNYIPDNVLQWMQSLPPYIIFNEPIVDNRKLLVSHTGYGLEADKNDWITAIWARHGHDHDMFNPDATGTNRDDGYFRVFGHTQQLKPWITETFAMIDTGAAYKRRGMGNLTAFHWPSKETISVATFE